MTRPHAGPPFRAVRSLMIVIAALVLAGCSSDGRSSGSAGGSPTTGDSTSATPTPASPTPQSAADGTDLSACKDGTCEVKVTRPVNIRMDVRRFKVGTVRLMSIKDDEVSFTITLPASGQFNFSCESTIVGATAESPAMGHVTGHAGALITANRITIQLVSIGNKSAILRLKPA
jgi:hypothetical protein